MSIAYRSATTEHAYGNHLHLSKPAGLANGDIMLAFCRTSGSAWIAPSGWTLLSGCGNTTIDGRHLDAFYRYVTNAAGEPASWQFNINVSTTHWLEGVIVAYSGAQSAPWTQDGWHNPSHWSSQTALADVAVRKNGVTVGCLVTGTGSLTFTPPTGFTERVDNQGDPGALEIVDKAWSVDGYSGIAYGSVSGSGEYNQSFHVSLLSANSAPTAPSSLYPTGNININRVAEQQFSWTFNDPDSGDTQSRYDLRYKKVADSTWTVVSRTTTEAHHDFAGGTFAAAAYEWQVRCYDTSGEVGPYSSSALFTGIDPPDGPTILTPLNGSTVAERHTMLWSVTDQAAYQIRTVADNAGAPNPGTIYTDTGTVTDAVARSRQITFSTNARYEHVQIRVQYNSLWSDWISARVWVQFTPPPVPTFTVSEVVPGALDIAITNPAPSGSQPAVLYNQVWIDDGLYDLGPELLTNTTMEGSDPPANWESNTAYGSYEAGTVSRSSTYAHGDTYSARVAWPTGAGKLSVLNHSGMGSLVTGEVYRLTGWLYVPNGSPDVRPVVLFFAAGPTMATKGQWVKVEWDFLAVSDWLFIGFETTTSPTSGTYLYLDDVSLRQVIGGLLMRQPEQEPNSTFRYWTPRSGRNYDSSNIRVLAVGANGVTTWNTP